MGKIVRKKINKNPRPATRKNWPKVVEYNFSKITNTQEPQPRIDDDSRGKKKKDSDSIR